MLRRHCEPTGSADARPMTGSAKQSIYPRALRHGFASLRPQRRGESGGGPNAAWQPSRRPVTYGRLLTLRTHARTSASTSGSRSLTSCTVMPGLIRGS